MTRHTITTTGYVLIDAEGATVAHEACFAEALHAMNHRYDRSEAVRRVSDGVLLATKHRMGGPFWLPLWRLVAKGAVV